ncbi:MAG: ribose uptake protein RbsU [Acetilactobacillus jinshanensis]
MLTGFNTGLGTFGYLVSLMLNGSSTAFTLSQMSIVVGTLAGLIVLHEHRTRKAMIYTMAGLILTVVGGVMTGFIH